MTNSGQHRSRTRNVNSWLATSALAIVIVFVLTGLSTQTAQAQTYQVIHKFAEMGSDGYQPMAGLAIDAAGNLYGTTDEDLYGYDGTVFRLAPKGQGWVFTTLHRFKGGSHDGTFPQAPVVFGPDGGLYGVTTGGGAYGNGVVFNLRPPARACQTALCPWTLSVLYNFNSYIAWDAFGALLFDAAGNIYGTTAQGGDNYGVLYELSPYNGSWTFTTLHTFAKDGTEGRPYAGVISDQAGNLYSTAAYTAYEFTTSGQFRVLHYFKGNDGVNALEQPILDSAGNLYGTTSDGGPGGNGTVWELSPGSGGWTLTTLHSYSGSCNGEFIGSASMSSDGKGNIYGTDYCGGAYGWGAIFKLTPSDGGWTYTSLHDFCAGGYPCTDGCLPQSNVVFDRVGNLYGTASGCGDNGDGEYGPGVVWEITP
jgi:uncharacterized repeat protein (TIGR03803 family)